MLFSTCDSNVEQAPFFFKCPRRIACHAAWKKIFFHADDKNIPEFKPFGRMDSH